mmetsp:Transcript_46889/g.106152  ORF Transcript_46889/g.106152 Transcript_46889/m.106152 type:complete len:270 (-) Transcript_46889:440-1249(-)
MSAPSASKMASWFRKTKLSTTATSSLAEPRRWPPSTCVVPSAGTWCAVAAGSTHSSTGGGWTSSNASEEPRAWMAAKPARGASGGAYDRNSCCRVSRPFSTSRSRLRGSNCRSTLSPFCKGGCPFSASASGRLRTLSSLVLRDLTEPISPRNRSITPRSEQPPTGATCATAASSAPPASFSPLVESPPQLCSSIPGEVPPLWWTPFSPSTPPPPPPELPVACALVLATGLMTISLRKTRLLPKVPASSRAWAPLTMRWQTAQVSTSSVS